MDISTKQLHKAIADGTAVKRNYNGCISYKIGTEVYNELGVWIDSDLISTHCHTPMGDE